jgi:outer membrane protein assembly factor BamB
MKILFSTPPSTRSQKRRLVSLISGLSLALTLSASAADLSAQKLFGKWNTTTNPTGFQMGGGPSTLTVSEKWIVAGTPLADEGAADQGAVQIFNATTGLWARKLSLPTPTLGNIRLGQSCSIAGDIVAIGAPDFASSTAGSVLIFNASTGLRTATIVLPTGIGDDGANGDQFGFAVALSGNRVLVGAPGDDAGKGSAYIYNYKDFTRIKLFDTAGAANDKFGTSVAVEGNIAIVGSPNMDGKGGFLAFDLNTGALLKRFSPTGAVAGDTAGTAVALAKGLVLVSATNTASPTTGKVVTYNLLTGAETTLVPSDSAAGDLFGSSISSTQGGLILIGASGKNTNQGAVYVYDLNSTATTELMKISAPPQSSPQSFGSACALFGETAFITASSDSTSAVNAGSIYIIKPIIGPMQLKKITAKGDFAPGAEGIAFNAFGDVAMNQDGEMAFTSSLTGPGSGNGRDTGVWSTLGGPSLTLASKSRGDFAGGIGTLNVISRALINEPSRAIFQASILPAGVSIAISAINNQVIYYGTGPGEFFRTGNPISTFETPPLVTTPGAVPLSFFQVAQARIPNLVSVACSLRLNVNGTLATNDSGLFTSDFSASPSAPLQTNREGFPASMTGPILGQFTGRVAQFDALTVFATALAGTTPKTADQAIFSRTLGNQATLISQKGITPVNNAEIAPITGAAFATYIGESADATNVLYRATIAGTPATVVPAAQNEGLWLHNGTTTRQILRKGVDLSLATASYVPAPGLVGVRIAKFLAFWQTNGQQLAFVQLAGTGVTGSNDQALLLLQSTPTNQLTVLLREGQLAPNCGGATVGVFNRVEVEPHRGTYLVLTTLVGAAKGTDLALFQGASSLPVTATTDTLRSPYLVLRKGQLFDNQPSKVKSFSLPTTNLTASGAGATGLGRAIQEGTDPSVITETAIVVEFDNGVRQIMKGKL